MSRLIIYHGPYCFDGLFSAWVAQHRWPEAALIPAKYGQEPPYERAKGADILVVDFSYSREQLEKLKQTARSLQVLDHHESAQSRLEGLDYCTFDMNKSGVMLAWDWVVNHTGSMPQICEADGAPKDIFRYVQDRDLWKFALPYSREVSAAMRLFGSEIESVDRIMATPLSTLIKNGEVVLDYQRGIIKGRIEKAEEFQFEGYKIRAVNSSVLASEIGHALADETTIGMVYHRSGGVWRYELRSIGEVACNKLAEKMGGGGHKHAAGFADDFLISPLDL